MQQSQQRSAGNGVSQQDAFGLFFIVIKSLATCLCVFTRHTFGSEALGWNGLGALAAILVYGTFAKVPEMFPFLLCWLAALCVQRIRTAWVRGQGHIMHSRDGGYPWLGFLLPSVKRYRTAMLMESAIAFGAGMLLCSVSEGLGHFIMAGAASLLLVYGIERAVLLKEVSQMRDAEIEMRMRTEVYHGHHTDL